MTDVAAANPAADARGGLLGRLRALAGRAPTPLADAIAALLGAESAFEQRDRVVEVFRVELRLVAAIALAARLQFGPGPDEAQAGAQLPELLRGLRGRGLTDGQWVALARELLKGFASAPEGHAVPALVGLVAGKKSELLKLWDELLVMRKSETVAHGATGTRDALTAILERRTPQLVRTLELLDAVWAELSLVVGHGGAALLLVGTTPPLGRFARLADEEAREGARALEEGQVSLIDASGRPRLLLSPVALVRAPHEGAAHELFLLDGPAKRGALYVAFPSMAEHRDPGAWVALDVMLSGDEAAPESAQGGELPARPYRGLESFGADEAALFFGREEQAESLANRIRRFGFVTVTGASGSGKTSLLRAGVLPLFRDAEVAFVRPGTHPLASLASRVAEALELPREEVAAACAQPSALRALVAGAAERAGGPFILVVDQAEELLTLTADEGEREAFARALAALGQGEGASHVVVSVREDFFARLATVKALYGLFSQHVEVVTTPDREGLMRILYGPAKAFGYAFEDEALIVSIVDAVEGASAALALLSFTADRLWDGRDRRWKQLTHKSYEAIGGALGALASHAEGVVGALSPSELAACRALFSRLVTGERTRAVVPRADLLSAARDAAEAERLVDRLVGARLLAASEDEAGQAQVEIVHEALIRHWDRLDRWLGEDSEGQRVAHAMRQAAKEWDSRGRAGGLLWRGEPLDDLTRWLRRSDAPLTEVERAFSDASRADAVRQRRLRIGLVVGAFAALLVFGVFMLFQWRAAETARREAEDQRQAASREKLVAEVRGLVAATRSAEARGLSDDAHALARAAVAVQRELDLPDSTDEVRDLARLEAAAAGAIVFEGAKQPLRLVAASERHARIFAAGADEDVLAWDAETGEQVASLSFAGYLVDALLVSPAEGLLLVRGYDLRNESAILRVYELPSLRERFSWKGKGIKDARFSPDEGLVAVLDRGAGLLLFDSEDGRSVVAEGSVEADLRAIDVGADSVVGVGASAAQLWTRRGQRLGLHRALGDKLTRVALGPDGDAFLVGDMSGKVTLARWSEPELAREVAHYKNAVDALQVLDEGRALVGVNSGGLHLVSLIPRRPALPSSLRDLDLGSGPTQISVRGATLAVVSESKRIERWDLETGALSLRRGGHDGEVADVALYGEAPVSVGWDRRARLWSPGRAMPVLGSVEGDPGLKLSGAARSADRRRVLYGGGDTATLLGKLVLIDVDARAAREVQPESAAGRLTGYALDRSGDRAVASFDDKKGGGEILLVDTGSRAVLDRVALPAAPRSLAATADLGVIAVGLESGALAIWSPRAAAPAGPGAPPADESALAIFPVHEANVHRVALSPDGALVASVGFDRTAKLTRARDGLPILDLPITAASSPLAFSPDGRTLAIGDYGEVDVFALDASGPLPQAGALGLFTTVDQVVFSLAFSPDGRSLALATAMSGEGGVALIDLASGATSKLSPTENVASLDFSRDGRALLGSGNEGAMFLWSDGREPARVTTVGREAVTDVCFVGDDDRALGFSFGPALPLIDARLLGADAALRESAAHTNLRVCRATLEVVTERDAGPSAWARDETCAARAQNGSL